MSPPPPSPPIPPTSPSLPILHQDPHLVVVDKPAGMLVVPAPGRSGATVVDVLGRQLHQRVHAVHRLDEDTTGVLVLARTLEAKAALEEIFRRHAARRVYLALTSHAPSPPAGRIESRLGEDRDGRVHSVAAGGERAVTHYRTLRRLERGGALVECELETGRRNQIRVHMAELGCAIVGDRKYGWRARRERHGAADRRTSGRQSSRRGDALAGPGTSGHSPTRPLLHAECIELVHPFSGEALAVRVAAAAPELRR